MRSSAMKGLSSLLASCCSPTRTSHQDVAPNDDEDSKHVQLDHAADYGTYVAIDSDTHGDQQNKNRVPVPQLSSYSMYVDVVPSQVSPSTVDRVLLGQGAFGKVYRGVWKGESVAIKTMSGGTSRQRASFQWEARRLKALSHPFIVQFKCLQELENNELQLILEYCPNGSLQDTLESDSALPIRTQWKFLLQLTSAVAYLHGRGMVHKDLKPENCLLTADETLKVADLGVSPVDRALLDHAQEQKTEVVEKGMKDPYWASPEEADHLLGDHAVDVFAIGLIGVHLLQGRPPWQIISQSHKRGRPALNKWLSALRSRDVAGELLAGADEHPLAAMLSLCLAQDSTQRTTVDKLLQQLLCSAPLCFDSPLAAATELVHHRNAVLAHEQRAHIAMFVSPHVTEDPLLEAVDDTTTVNAADEKQPQQEQHSLPQTELMLAALDSRISGVDTTTVLLVGPGGTGKTLVSFVYAHTHTDNTLVFLMRPAVHGRWTTSSLKGLASVALQQLYRLPQAVTESLRSDTTLTPVFWFDGFDELEEDVPWDDIGELRRFVGLDAWPHARVVISSRRQQAAMDHIRQACARPPRVLYVLPFTRHQTVQYLQTADRTDTAEPDPATLDMLRIPLLLHLYCISGPSHTQGISKPSDLYRAAVAHWSLVAGETIAAFPPRVRDKLWALLASPQTQLPSNPSNLPTVEDSFEACAMAVAQAMWKVDHAVGATVIAATSMSGNSARGWLEAKSLLRTAAQDDYMAVGTNDRLIAMSDYVALLAAVWDELMQACPLRLLDGHVSFAHKAFRDYFIARMVVDISSVAQPEDLLESNHLLCYKPLTADAAVVDMCTQLVDALEAAKSAKTFRKSAVAKPPRFLARSRFENNAWHLVQLSRGAPLWGGVAANCLTILCSLGVSFSGMNFSNCHLGDEKWPSDKRFPFMDLSGAMLHSANLCNTVMCGSRLQGCCLDGADLSGCNLLLTDWGEFAPLSAPDDVRALTCTSNGRLLISATKDKALSVWDTDTGAVVRQLRGHEDVVTTLVTSNDDEVVGGSRDGAVRIWCLTDGTLTQTLRGHTDAVLCVRYLHDKLVSGSSDGSVRVWDLALAKCVALMRSSEDSSGSSAVRALEVSADTVFSAGDSKYVHRWQTSAPTKPVLLLPAPHPVLALVATADGRYLFGGSEASSIFQWDLDSGTIVRHLVGHTGYVYSLSLAEDQHTLVSGSSDFSVGIWAVSSGRALRFLRGHSRTVRSVAIAPTASPLLLFSGGDDQLICRWELQPSHAATAAMAPHHTGQIISIKVHASRGVVFTGSTDALIGRWRAIDGHFLGFLEGHTSHVTALHIIGDVLYSASADRTIRRWGIDTGVCLSVLRGHKQAVNVLCVSTDGHWLFSGSEDKTLRCWEVSTGALRHSWKHCYPVRAVATHPELPAAAFSKAEDRSVRLFRPGEDAGVLATDPLPALTWDVFRECQVEHTAGDTTIVLDAHWSVLEAKQQGIIQWRTPPHHLSSLGAQWQTAKCARSVRHLLSYHAQKQPEEYYYPANFFSSDDDDDDDYDDGDYNDDGGYDSC